MKLPRLYFFATYTFILFYPFFMLGLAIGACRILVWFIHSACNYMIYIYTCNLAHFFHQIISAPRCIFQDIFPSGNFLLKTFYLGYTPGKLLPGQIPYLTLTLIQSQTLSLTLVLTFNTSTNPIHCIPAEVFGENVPQTKGQGERI